MLLALPFLKRPYERKGPAFKLHWTRQHPQGGMDHKTSLAKASLPLLDDLPKFF